MGRLRSPTACQNTARLMPWSPYRREVQTSGSRSSVSGRSTTVSGTRATRHFWASAARRLDLMAGQPRGCCPGRVSECWHRVPRFCRLIFDPPWTTLTGCGCETRTRAHPPVKTECAPRGQARRIGRVRSLHSFLISRSIRVPSFSLSLPFSLAAPPV